MIRPPPVIAVLRLHVKVGDQVAVDVDPNPLRHAPLRQRADARWNRRGHFLDTEAIERRRRDREREHELAPGLEHKVVRRKEDLDVTQHDKLGAQIDQPSGPALRLLDPVPSQTSGVRTQEEAARKAYMHEKTARKAHTRSGVKRAHTRESGRGADRTDRMWFPEDRPDSTIHDRPHRQIPESVPGVTYRQHRQIAGSTTRQYYCELRAGRCCLLVAAYSISVLDIAERMRR
eukprot:1621838-Rhodomonas_salina.1